MKHLIVIDDTGSPGNFNETRFLKEDRKTLVAVFIHAELRHILEKILSEILDTLKKDYPITEFHFKDIVNKNNEFSGFTYEQTIKLVDEIADVFAQFKLPFFVQTIHKKTLQENGIFISKELNLGNLNLKESEDNAIFSLLLTLREFAKKKYANDRIEIFMDQRANNKTEFEKFEFLGGVADNTVHYKSSAECTLIQVADFFAYAVNRMQTTSAKENRTNLDKALLFSFSKALARQPSTGVLKLEVDIDEFKKDDYDYELYQKRQIDGNLEFWKNAQKDDSKKD
ncbi:DUF3800 domain-containing protein [Flavobacterium sp. Root420]|uniref:DUF3800 domain-containing protein n=1 Tax=Flavobacterium sp. Root420 TaxID=1736533 RepID=UPI0007011A72|nr:DUF3800 domain-containing protein [Flavobacterium sp. Root420]KQX00766.1 hypothetical protein ASC72_07845 [Flavobacterium sp. Root420]